MFTTENTVGYTAAQLDRANAAYAAWHAANVPADLSHPAVASDWAQNIAETSALILESVEE